MKQISILRYIDGLLLLIFRVAAIKQIANKTWLLAFLLFPSVLLAQVKERQAGDTTYYPTLIPEAKQSLLKNMSMIANMRFAQRNEFVDGEHTKSRFTMEQFRLEI